MTNKDNLPNSINNRISDLLIKLSSKSEENKEVIELLTDVQELLPSRFPLFDYIQVGIAVYEAIDNGNNFVYVEFNKKAESIERILKEKVIGKKLTEVFPGAEKFGILDALKKVWKTGEPIEHPISIYKDGRIRRWRENYIFKIPSGEIVISYFELTRQKQIEEKVALSETNLKSLINNRKEFIWSIDCDYNYKVCNDFLRKKYYEKYKIDLDVGINALDLLSEDDYSFWKSQYDRALNGEKFSFEHKEIVNNSTSYFEVSFNPIIVRGQINGVTAVSRDITDKKIAILKIKESEEKYRAIFENSEVNMIIFDPETLRIVDANKGAERFYGWTREEFIGMKIGKINLMTDNEVRNMISKVKKEQIHYFEFKHKKKDESICDVAIIRGDIVLNNKDLFYLIVTDISIQKNAEDEVRKREENYRGIFNSTTDAIYLLDKNMIFLDVNSGAERMYGVKKEELIGKTPADLSAPEMNNLEKVKKLNLLAYKGKPQTFEFWGIRKNGEVFPKEVRVFPGFYNGEKIIIAVGRDISERKKHENEIKASEEKFRNLIQFAPDAFFHGDLKGNIILCNEAAEKITGYSANELLGMNISELFSKEELKKKPLRYDLLEKGETVSFERRITRKDGKDVLVEMTSKKLNDNTYQSFMRDITERKISELALKESESNFRLLFENSPLGTFIADKNGNIIDGNRALLKMIGSPSIEETKKINLLEFPPLKENGYAKLFKQCIREKETIAFNIEYKSKWGVDAIYSTYLIPLIDEEGTVNKIYTLMEDITQRYNAENSLRESEQLFRNLNNSTSTAIFIFQNEKFVFVNKSTEIMTGYSKKELLAMNFWDVVHPDHKELVRKRGLKRQRGEKVLPRYQFKLIKKDGNETWIDFTANIIQWAGNPAAIGSAVDISELKNAEANLRKSEEQYRLISNLTSDYLFSIKIGEDGSSIMDWAGGSFKEITGYSLEEYREIGLYDTVYPEDREILEIAFRKLQKNRSVKIELRIFKKNNNIVWVEMFGSPVWDSYNNRLVGIRGAVKDITKEKLAELALKESKEKYKIISNITSDYIYETSFDNDKLDVIWVAGSFKKMTGYTLDEYKKAGAWYAHLHKGDFEADKKALEELKHNVPTVVQVRTYHKSGRIIWVENTASPVWDSKKNQLIGIIGAVKDITEEKRSEIIQSIQYNIADAISKSQKTKNVFDVIRKELQGILSAENFYIAFYDEKKNKLVSDVIADQKDNITEWSVEGSLSGYLINKKRKLLIKEDEILHLIETKKIRRIGVVPKVWLGVPLRTRGKVIGIMAIQSYDDENAYSKSDVELFEVIGNQLSLFIERNKTKEDALRLSRAIMQSPVSVAITNQNGEIEFVNPQFEKSSGYTFEELIGTNNRILKSGHQTKEFYEELWNTILSGLEWSGEILNKKKNGSLYWENVIISPIIAETGEISHFVAIKEDITEKKSMIEELIKSKEKAEVSEKIKTEFLAQMSHEIRSPLNVILSFIGLIKDSVSQYLNEDLEYSFNSIDSASSRIIRTIDLILNMTDLQIGSYEPNIQELNVVDLLKNIEHQYIQSANNKGLELKLNLQFKRKRIVSDDYALGQIISNLVDNAIKYTNKGMIEIFADKLENRGLIVKVIDTGIGMSEEYLPNLFDTFTQEEQGYSRSFDGNGLGMALVKKYCEIIDATISVKSKKGEGSVFTIVIPNLKKEIVK